MTQNMDQKECEFLGTIVGQKHRPFPGLASLAHKLSDLSREVAQLEGDAYELKQIRATLLLNFGWGSSHNNYDFAIKEDQTTLEMLMFILEECCKPAPRVGMKSKEQKNA